MIINTPIKPDDLRFDVKVNIATVDAGGIAMRNRLMREGKPIVNTPMLGAFAKATNLVSLDAMEKGLKGKISSAVYAANAAVLRDAFEQTLIRTAD
jgi:Pyruvate/2-oxoacid:ferredoxin oxidoreductase gamma subunit